MTSPTLTPTWFLKNAPGLTGAIARIIHSRLEYDEPLLALGAAISFVGALKSRRYISPTGIAPNVYICLVALTGVGKTQAQKTIQEIAALSESSSLLMGAPASESGLLSALEEEPRRLLMWDEFGIALSALSKTKNSYEATILSSMLNLFSFSNSKALGKSYSKNSQSSKTTNLQSPCLNLFGASTPTRFFGALNEDFVKDGFLPRFLLFISQGKLKPQDPTNLPITDEILREIRYINQGQPLESGGDVEMLWEKKLEVLTYEHSEKLPDLYRKLYKQNRTEALDELEDNFLSRNFEHYVKLSIIFADKGIATFKTDEYAKKLSDYLVSNAARICRESLFENDKEKKESELTQKILLFIEKNEGTVTRQQLNRAFSRNTDIRDKVVKELCNAELIQQVSNGQRGGLSYKSIKV